jgi:hypothetical protein
MIWLNQLGVVAAEAHPESDDIQTALQRAAERRSMALIRSRHGDLSFIPSHRHVGNPREIRKWQPSNAMSKQDTGR